MTPHVQASFKEDKMKSSFIFVVALTATIFCAAPGAFAADAIMNYQTIVDGQPSPGFGAGITRAASKDAAVANCKAQPENDYAQAQASCDVDRNAHTTGAGAYNVLVYCEFNNDEGQLMRQTRMGSSGYGSTAVLGAVKRAVGAKADWNCYNKVVLHNGQRE